MGGVLRQPKQPAGFPAHRLKIPPQVPLADRRGLCGGSAVGRPAHGLPPPLGRCSVAAAVPARLAQRLQRSRPADMSHGVPAAGVPPRERSARLARRPSRGDRITGCPAARLRAWRVSGVAFGTSEHQAERSAATCEPARSPKRASVMRSMTDTEARRSPGTGRAAASCPPAQPAWPDGVRDGSPPGARRRYPGGSTHSATARPRAAGRRPGPPELGSRNAAPTFRAARSASMRNLVAGPAAATVSP